MNLLIIALAVPVLAGDSVEMFSRVIAKKKKKARFDRMSPDAQRKHQEEMYKRHQMG